MALEPDDSPAALNRDLRAWVKNWTGKGIGQVALGANISNSRAYAATANTNLVPRDLLLAIVRAAVPTTYDSEERTEWIRRWSREWERRWERVEAAARGDEPRPISHEPVAELRAQPSARPNPIRRLTREIALRALDPVITNGAVRDIAAEFVFAVQDPLPVGYHDEPALINVYIDLHSAACDPHNRNTLAKFIADLVDADLGRLEPRRTAIAAPREGNLLVASRVAELCGVPFLMVRTTPNPPRFGSPIEGNPSQGGEALVIDDLVMGTLIPRVAHVLRTHAVAANRCFSIFERSDVGARATLAAADVTLHSAFQLDQDVLSSLHRLFGQYS